MNFAALVLTCAPYVHPTTARAIVAVESAFNPYAIGVVGDVLERQPSNREEAVATARSLRAAGRNFSAGLAQISVRNWERNGLTIDTVFDPCQNLRAMQRVLRQCYARASMREGDGQVRLRAALSCYYAGDFAAGFRDGYVARVLAAAGNKVPPPRVPATELP